MTKYYLPNHPSKTSFPISKSGLPYVYILGFITLIFSLLNVYSMAFIFLFLTLFTCFFFRDPDRLVPIGNKFLVSPADGKIIKIEKTETNHYLKTESLKVSIFMSIFNVHVNRIPIGGLVKEVNYIPGLNFIASSSKSSLKNERNALVIKTKNNEKICLVQVAGLIARRILCSAKVGDVLKKGERYGMICFGSRLDFYLPPKTKICVKVGDKVLAGSSIIGEI